MNIKWKDQALKNDELVFGYILLENKKQIEKWGIQNLTPFEWMTFLTEEVGELAQAISELAYRNGTHREVFNEAIQVATLASKIAEIVR
jgi:NTP pyrophosphatase (non-canonical NTP hydrolase)